MFVDSTWALQVSFCFGLSSQTAWISLECVDRKQLLWAMFYSNYLHRLSWYAKLRNHSNLTVFIKNSGEESLNPKILWVVKNRCCFVCSLCYLICMLEKRALAAPQDPDFWPGFITCNEWGKFLCFVCSLLLVPCGKFGHHTLGHVTQLQKQQWSIVAILMQLRMSVNFAKVSWEISPISSFTCQWPRDHLHASQLMGAAHFSSSTEGLDTSCFTLPGSEPASACR